MAQFPTAVATDSDLYIAVNLLSTTITDNPLSAGATTVNVLSTTLWPTVGAISIDAEIIHYTGKTLTSLTGCTRGFDGSTAASHAVNTPGYHRVIAAHHNVLKDEIKAIEQNLNDRIGLHATQIILQANLDANSKKITGLAAATTNGDAVRYEQAIGVYLPLSGGTLTGNVAMSGTQKLTGLAAGTTNGDSIRYEQVIGQFLPIGGGTLTGTLFLTDGNVGNPSLSFSNDTDTGLYRAISGTPYLGFSVGGVLQFYAQNGLVINTGVILNNVGSVSAPGYTFSTDSDTGMYTSGSGSIDFATNGVQRATITSAGLTLLSSDLMVRGVLNTGGVKIQGTNTNDSASAGYVGEYFESKSASFNNFPSTNTYGDATSLSLTAGDWDVTLCIVPYSNTSGPADWTDTNIGISSTSGNSSSGLNYSENRLRLIKNTLALDMAPMTIAAYRVSLASTTTYYAKVQAVYSAGQPVYTYRFSARRVR